MPVTITEIGSERTRLSVHRPSQTYTCDVLARSRKAADGLGYGGDVTPEEAWRLLSTGIAELVDVRTDSELTLTGRIPGAMHIEWTRADDPKWNSRFVSDLRGKVATEDVVLFVCRSGRRSLLAAREATKSGFRHAFNVLEGVEGDGNPPHGWLNRALPITKA